jgi:hypothetical protein
MAWHGLCCAAPFKFPSAAHRTGYLILAPKVNLGAKSNIPFIPKLFRQAVMSQV